MSDQPSGTPGIDAFGLTDVGRVRKNNEDQFLVSRLERSMQTLHCSLQDGVLEGEQRAWLFVVADGVGGSAAGELASRKAIETLALEIATASGCFHMSGTDEEHEFIDRLEAAMRAADERVKRELAMAGSRPATTATMVMLLWPRGYIFHVGDSRGYYLRGERLRQFTRDQTVGEFMVDAGILTEEETARRGLNNVLTHAIGGEDPTPSIGLLDFKPGDVLLLCSDGLTKHVSDDAIRATLERASGAESACRELVEAALAGGGSDNITVVVARMSDA